MVDTFAVWTTGEVVSIAVKLSDEVEEDRRFDSTFEDEMVADVIAGRIVQMMEQAVETLVKRSYEKGWRDARGRQAKATCFTPCLNSSAEVAWR